MSKFCGNCGAQLPDDALVCGMCGTSITPVPSQNPSPYQAPAPEQSQYYAPYSAPTPAQNPKSGNGFIDKIKKMVNDFFAKFKSDKKFMIKSIVIVGGALTLLIATIIILVCVFGGGYEKAIDNRIDAQYGDYDAYIDCYPEAYWDDHDMPDEDDFLYGDWADEFDDDYDIDYEVIDEDKIVGSEFTVLKSMLRENWGVAKKDVTEAYSLEVLLQTETDDEDYFDLETMTVVKIDGDWYVVD